jgi:hypothetical protein
LHGPGSGQVRRLGREQVVVIGASYVGKSLRHPLTVWETAVPELFETRLLNTFSGQSPPAGNRDRGPAGRVSENRSAATLAVRRWGAGRGSALLWGVWILVGGAAAIPVGGSASAISGPACP